MHLLSHSNGRCHQINLDQNLKDSSFFVLFGFQHWCWLGQTCAVLACCVPTVCQNAASPWICPAFGIMFLPMPAWHYSVISAAYVNLTVPSSTAQRHRGMVLICGTEKQCVQKMCTASSPLIFYSVPPLKYSFFFAFACSNYLFQPVLLLPSFLRLCRVQYPNGRSCNALTKVKCVTTYLYKWNIVVLQSCPSLQIIKIMSSYFFFSGDICQNNCKISFFSGSWVSSSIHVLQKIWQRHS